MKKGIICVLIIFCITAYAIRHFSLEKTLGIYESEYTFSEQLEMFLDKYMLNTQAEKIQDVRDRYNIYLIKESDYVGDRINEINSILNENETISVIKDNYFHDVLNYYYVSKAGENGKPSGEIKSVNNNSEKVLLSNILYISLFDGYTKASRIIEIANQDKDVIYVATLDNINEISLEEVPDNMHIKYYYTETDENGVVKCICYFAPDFE